MPAVADPASPAAPPTEPATSPALAAPTPFKKSRRDDPGRRVPVLIACPHVDAVGGRSRRRVWTCGTTKLGGRHHRRIGRTTHVGGWGYPSWDGLTGRSRQVNDVCLGHAVRDLVTAVGPGLAGALGSSRRSTLCGRTPSTGETATQRVVVRAWGYSIGSGRKPRQSHTRYRWRALGLAQIGSSDSQHGCSSRCAPVTMLVRSRHTTGQPIRRTHMPRYMVQRTFPDGLQIPVGNGGSELCETDRRAKR